MVEMSAQVILFLSQDSRKPNYSPRKLKRALHDVKTGQLTQRKAASTYGIPRSTIQAKVKGKSPADICKRGPPPGLGE